jgi:hypothetical protein
MATWTPINDTQTPLSAGGFQAGAFQTNFEQNIFQLPVWVLVNDAQAGITFAGFQANEFQPNEFESYEIDPWTIIVDAQTPLSAGGFQAGAFQTNFEQNIYQLPVWIEINDSQ